MPFLENLTKLIEVSKNSIIAKINMPTIHDRGHGLTAPVVRYSEIVGYAALFLLPPTPRCSPFTEDVDPKGSPMFLRSLTSLCARQR